MKYEKLVKELKEINRMAHVVLQHYHDVVLIDFHEYDTDALIVVGQTLSLMKQFEHNVVCQMENLYNVSFPEEDVE